MIVNLFPSMEFFEENLQVLNFAAVAKQIVVQKATVRKATSRYSRYSILIKSAFDSPRKVAGNGSYSQNSSVRESLDSLVDSSFEFDHMTEFDLRAELRRKEREAQLYREEVIKLNNELLDRERNIKDKMIKQQIEARNREKELYEQQLENKEQYYQKKVRKFYHLISRSSSKK
jgi:kinesin family protein 20